MGAGTPRQDAPPARAARRLRVGESGGVGRSSARRLRLPGHWSIRSCRKEIIEPVGTQEPFVVSASLVVPLFRLVPPSTRKSLFVRGFRDKRLPPYRLVMCSTTQLGPNLAPICGTTRDPAVQRACPQPRSHSSHWRSTAALPSAHPDITSDRLNHDRKSLHSRPNH